MAVSLRANLNAGVQLLRGLFTMAPLEPESILCPRCYYSGASSDWDTYEAPTSCSSQYLFQQARSATVTYCDRQAITITWSSVHQLRLELYTLSSLLVPSTMVKSPFTDYSVTHHSLVWNKKTSNKSLNLRITSDSFTGYFVTKGLSRLASEQAQFRLNLFQAGKRTLHTYVSTKWHPSKNLVTEFSKLAALYFI
jgi:hypothetical protein